MKTYHAFCTFQCVRCNRRESRAAAIGDGRHVGYVGVPRDWGVIDGGEYCGPCASVVRGAMRGLKGEALDAAGLAIVLFILFVVVPLL